MKKLLCLFAVNFVIVTNAIANNMENTLYEWETTCHNTDDGHVRCAINNAENPLVFAFSAPDIKKFNFTGVFKTDLKPTELIYQDYTVGYDFTRGIPEIILKSMSDGSFKANIVGFDGALPVKLNDLRGLVIVNKPFKWQTKCNKVSENMIKCAIDSDPKMSLTMVTVYPILNFSFSGITETRLSPFFFVGKYFWDDYDFTSDSGELRLIDDNVQSVYATLIGIAGADPVKADHLLSSITIIE